MELNIRSFEIQTRTEYTANYKTLTRPMFESNLKKLIFDVKFKHPIHTQ